LLIFSLKYVFFHVYVQHVSTSNPFVILFDKFSQRLLAKSQTVREVIVTYTAWILNSLQFLVWRLVRCFSFI